MKQRKKRSRNILGCCIAIIICITYLFISNDNNNYIKYLGNKADYASEKNNQLSDIPKYDGKAYITVNNNVPMFTDDEITTTSYESYGELDYLGRCNTAMACIGTDIMPDEERGDISSVEPSGWQSIKAYDVDGGWLYNRCHLIAFCLTGENDNEKNLITGTRYMNVEGMLPFEEMVLDYVKETDNHVMYRVAPVFEGVNLIASGVEMEGYSVEDKGEGISFNVYCYNVQDGYEINYLTGKIKQ